MDLEDGKLTIDDGELKIDSAALTRCIEKCFAMSRDGRLSLEQRRGFLIQGKVLRGHLINLISAVFDDARAVEEADQAMRDLNQKLVEAFNDLAAISQALEVLASVSGLLGNLLKLAVSFA